MPARTVRYRLGVAMPTLLLLGCLALLFFGKPEDNGQAARASGKAVAALPHVEPLILRPVALQDARAMNSQTPFSREPNPPAPPFVFTGSADARGRAADCLAAAMLYEAGADAAGQQAVGQVIINRARHPAFPKSICGVVFQGSERRTGCQFTFTCDGALLRRYSAAAWQNAQGLAGAVLSGSVDATVGHATHYHTDWVVPYWSSSLDKITAVGTHLFFRWHGSWGRPAAFRRGITGQEPVIAKLSALSAYHSGGVLLADDTAPLPPTELADTGQFRAAKQEIITGGGARLLLDKASRAEEYLALALAKCADKSYCKILGWSGDGDIPAVGELTEAARGSMVFSYLRDEKNAFEKALWNCQIYPRSDKRQCMKR